MLKIPEFDFDKIIDTHRNPTFKRHRDWEKFYADAANDIYDSWEYLSEIIKILNTTTSVEIYEIISNYISKLERQINTFMDLMIDGEYESHYYDRLWHELCNMREKITTIKQLISKRI